MPKKYKITPVAWLVKDEASVKFHVENNDYFGTIAAVLSLIKEEIKKGKQSDLPTFNKVLKNLEEELLFLQKNYQINPKSKKKNKTPKGKLISQ
ncbi:MAG: hypothetical protein WCN88_03865 [Candidatus Falkowbacteria bacterium]